MPNVQIEVAAGVATVTIDNAAKKNAVTPPMWAEMATILRDVARDDDVRALVLTGAEGEFCSGADLWVEADAEPPHPLASMHRVAEAIQALHDLPKPTIAKVPGVAAGAGCSLALGCDLVVAAERARFSMIFAKRGLALDGGASWLLPRLVGMHRAKELAYFADILSAADASEMGLVNRVVPDADLDAFVDDWAARLAAGPPLAYALTKRLLNDSLTNTMSEMLEHEARAQAVTLGSKDTAEAIGAFVERREPQFRGR